MIESILTSQDVYLRLARFMAIVFLGIFATRTVLMPLSGRIISRKNPDAKARHSVENIAGLTGLFGTFIIALQFGDLGNLVTVLGTIAAALTVAIGFGMRDQVSSVVAGIFIHTDNPFVKGDYIKVNDYEGVVQDIRLRATTLNGKNSIKQVVPNNILTQNVVKNLTKETKTRGVIETGIESSKLEEASNLFLKASREQDEVLEKPEPEISYTGLDDGKVKVKLSYWVKEAGDVKSVRTKILKSFNQKAAEKGIFKEEEKDDETE